MNNMYFNENLKAKLISFFCFLIFSCNVFADSLNDFIQNSDFETGKGSPWIINSWGGSVASIQTAAPGINNSNYSLKIAVSVNPVSSIFKHVVQLQAGNVYQVSAWVKADQETQVSMRLQKDVTAYNTWGLQNITATKDWQQIVFLASPKDNDPSRVVFMLSDVNIPVYLDNISVKDVTQFNAANFNKKIIPKTLFGMHSNKGHVLDLWPVMNEVNVGMIRLWDSGVDWSAVEAQKGTFNWTRLQMYIDRIKKYVPDTKIIYTFGRVPGWANDQKGGSYAPLNMDDWRNFVTNLVEKYGSFIDYYEIWNEFDYSLFWADTSEKLLEMHKIAYEVIKQKDATAKILLPNITIFGLPRLGEYLSLGGGNYADIASLHFYPQFDAIEEAFAFVTSVRSLLDSYGHHGMPIFNTEGSPVTAGKTLTAKQEKSSVAKYILMTWLSGMDSACWYFWENIPENNRIVFASDSGSWASKKESAMAYRQLAVWLVGSNITDFIVDSNSQIYQIKVEKDGKYLGWIVWTKSQALSYKPPEDWKINAIDLLDGSAKNYEREEISLDVEPIFLKQGDIIKKPAGSCQHTCRLHRC
jgi:hypothetical protein